MARYWVGTTQDWHDPTNWSLTSGGAGGAGVPTLVDDVFVDGNGFALCWAASPTTCRNATLTVAATEMVIFDQGGVVAGDFLQNGGTFSPTGGGGYVIDFQGDWRCNGGSFSVGTGTGVDPTCQFSKIGGTYVLDSSSAASYQHFSMPGSYTMSGTRLTVASISQNLSVTGTMTIDAGNRVNLSGGFDVFTGTIDGDGRFWYKYGTTQSMPTSGTIKCKYFRFYLDGDTSSVVDVDLDVDGWTNIHADWTHEGAEPWIDSDDGDSSRITLPADAASIGLYDEEYSIADVPAHDLPYSSIAPTRVKVHFVTKLVPGTGGPATLVVLRGWLWDGAAWVDAGTAVVVGTTYVDRACSGSLHASINSLAKLDDMRLKVEVDTVIGGGADKGDVAVTRAYVEVEGVGAHAPLAVLNPRTYDSPCDVELEYVLDGQVLRMEGGARHFFMGYLTVHGNHATIMTALLDMDTETAEIWVSQAFDIDQYAFPSAIFTWRLGDGLQVFRHSVNLYFNYSSVNTHLVIDAGEGTVLLWPRGRQVVPPPRLEDWGFHDIDPHHLSECTVPSEPPGGRRSRGADLESCDSFHGGVRIRVGVVH